MDYRKISLIILVMAVVFLAGCTSQKEPAASEQKAHESVSGDKPAVQNTPAPHQKDDTATVILTDQNGTEPATEMQTGSHETMPLNDTINIYLKENPTTGFMWNATVTAGLRIENDTYIADPAEPGIVGSGGMHYWLIRGIEKGNQTFDAIYKRSWEPETGDETRYIMEIQVL